MGQKQTLADVCAMSALCETQTFCAAVKNVVVPSRRRRHKQLRWHTQPDLLVCRRRLTNSFFLKDRCSLSDQISFVLASNWRAFILAMRDRDRANEIETFVFSVIIGGDIENKKER
jgi:hypothetical protein